MLHLCPDGTNHNWVSYPIFRNTIPQIEHKINIRKRQRIFFKSNKIMSSLIFRLKTIVRSSYLLLKIKCGLYYLYNILFELKTLEMFIFNTKISINCYRPPDDDLIPFIEQLHGYIGPIVTKIVSILRFFSVDHSLRYIVFAKLIFLSKTLNPHSTLISRIWLF